MPAFPAPGPLNGIRVLDLTRILAGPFCSMVLADLGADVVKVEEPSGDQSRQTGPFVETDSGARYSTYFMSVNRGKRSIVIDLKHPEGRSVFLNLADTADVVLENFRPGVMDRLGVGYDVLKVRNPRMIMASVSGFGQTGPLASRAALDVIVQAMGGILSITGEPGGGPVRPGVSMGDITAALFTSIAVLAAVVERDRSNEGQRVDVSMLDCQAAILENPLMRYFALGEMPERLGTRHPVVNPVQAFRTADGYVAISASDGPAGHWGALCRAIERPGLLDDHRFDTSWGRTQHLDEMIPVIAEAMAERTTAEWVSRLAEAGVPVGPVQDVAQVAADPQLRSRHMFAELEHPVAGPVTFVNTPIKMSRTQGGPRSVQPELGEHTDDVLGDLGLSAADIATLRRQGAVA